MMARSVLPLPLASHVLLAAATYAILVSGYPSQQDGASKKSLRTLIQEPGGPHHAEDLLPQVYGIQQNDPGTEHRRGTRNLEQQDSVAEASEREDIEGEDPVPQSQHFFPSFSPIFPALGHSKPPFYQEPFTHRPSDSFGFGSGSFRDYSFTHAPAESERSANVLGSGNFGVLRGGTYYPGENDEVLNDDLYNNYYNNGHGRPSFYPPNPLPSFRQGGDFFANFKDFADISTPSKSYSQYYVVYVNPNATADNLKSENTPIRSDSVPKNIFEQLQILDATSLPEKKVSKLKKKLEKYQAHQKTKESSKKQKILALPKEQHEPLLALS